MATWIQQRNELLGKAVIANLAKRNMEGYYCATKEEALQKALDPVLPVFQQRHGAGLCRGLKG